MRSRLQTPGPIDAKHASNTDTRASASLETNTVAEPDDPGRIAAPMSGELAEIYVAVGEGRKPAATESMKMLNVIHAPAGEVIDIELSAGSRVQPGDLLLRLALA